MFNHRCNICRDRFDIKNEFPRQYEWETSLLYDMLYLRNVTYTASLKAALRHVTRNFIDI